MHWSDRQQQRQEQHQQQTQQQQAPQLPFERAAADDTIDVLEACGCHAQQAQWRHIWELASASYLDRRHRVLWWRLLHGTLMCGAYKSYIGRATPAQANCPFSCCSSPSQPQTISHFYYFIFLGGRAIHYTYMDMHTCGFFFFFFGFFIELFITHTWTCNERNHKCQTEGHPQPKQDLLG